MNPLDFDDLPGWTFEVREVSAGVYVGSGRSASGANVQIQGEDPEQLLARCREFAAGVAE
jgi:hypothetical protein